uniref:Uncharacterized protein n=1 Tax=Anguilla anguilla TaxID=7936 RepID=A0A0E9RWR9_ANGAN
MPNSLRTIHRIFSAMMVSGFPLYSFVNDCDVHSDMSNHVFNHYSICEPVLVSLIAGTG